MSVHLIIIYVLHTWFQVYVWTYFSSSSCNMNWINIHSTAALLGYSSLTYIWDDDICMCCISTYICMSLPPYLVIYLRRCVVVVGWCFTRILVVLPFIYISVLLTSIQFLCITDTDCIQCPCCSHPYDDDYKHLLHLLLFAYILLCVCVCVSARARARVCACAC